MSLTFFECFSSSIGAGGLFDFDATLVFMIIQFLILMFVLNNILYNPLLNVIEERNEYVTSTLGQSAKLILETDQITKTYEAEISEARKAAQLEIDQSQKKYKEIFDIEVSISQEEFDKILTTAISRLLNEKESALSHLKESSQIEELGELIKQKILLKY